LNDTKSSTPRLHVFPHSWDLNPSPFCLKVETYCRLAGIATESVPALPFRAPRGKLPFLEDGRERIPDSGLIIEYLKRRFGDSLDDVLNARQAATGHLLRRTCEESLYFVLVYSRWIDPEGWKLVKPTFFGSMPPLARDAVAALARSGVRRALHAQGYGRHTRDGIYAIGAADLAAIAVTIAGQAYAVSHAPTSFDATLYGILANILTVPLETELTRQARRHPELVAYIERMRSALSEAISSEADPASRQENAPKRKL
jgi:glutathione S-transferase